MFRDEAMDLRHLANTHFRLFEAGEETDAVLQRTAAAFFADLSGWLQEVFILRVSRLTDPVKTAGNSNLTLPRIVDDLRAAGLLTDSIQKRAVEMAEYRALNIDAPRNKAIAHFDLKQARNPAGLGQHDRAALDAFLEGLQRFCAEVGNAIGVGPLDFRCQPGPGDVVDLVRHLRRPSP